MDLPELREQRSTFFKVVYSGTRGYICLATLDKEMKNFEERFFFWPDQFEEFLDEIDRLTFEKNVYYCPQVFGSPRRTKGTVSHVTCAWADLDDCNPDDMEPQPSFAVESSPRKYQGLWMFDRLMEPKRAEDVSRRIAAAYRSKGADHCWNLARLLRVPGTFNFKYAPPKPVIFNGGHGGRFRESDFDALPRVQGTEYTDIPFPEPDELPEESARQLIQKYRLRIDDLAVRLFEEVPEEGKTWSEPLWSMLMLLFEANLTREEVFVVAQEASCNKFARDGKPPEYLWSDVCRAFMRHEFNSKVIAPKKELPDPVLISDKEREYVEKRETWIERYIKWASGLGDAAPQYHQAGAFVGLSSTLAGSLRLPTSFGSIIPNLWFMILADTTLTRKTTSMDIAMDLITDVDDKILLATDGSIEGLFTALSTRPGQPSVFLRDEFSGLLEQMTKRDYMAGMPETLTKLYDGKVQKRVLRKEIVEIRDPIVILYTGGIRTKIQEILTLEQIASGFLPRFIFITAESDLARVQGLGPPTEKNLGIRDEIVRELQELKSSFTGLVVEIVNGKPITIPNSRRVWSAKLTDHAWTRYNELESTMMAAGVQSRMPEVYTPVYDRLGKSILKAAVLIAASRQAGADEITVELGDLLHAIYYGNQWRDYAKEVVVNVGHSKDEKRLQTVYNAVIRSGGIARSALMQAYHLDARSATSVLETLEQRGLIIRNRVNKTEMVYPLTEDV